MGRAVMGAMGGAGDAAPARKISWPEVVGWNYLSAGLRIHADRPDIVRFEFHYFGDHVAPGRDNERVRLFLTPGPETVAIPPVVG